MALVERRRESPLAALARVPGGLRVWLLSHTEPKFDSERQIPTATVRSTSDS